MAKRESLASSASAKAKISGSQRQRKLSAMAKMAASASILKACRKRNEPAKWLSMAENGVAWQSARKRVAASPKSAHQRNGINQRKYVAYGSNGNGGSVGKAA